ncbi:flagellar biosynthesis anti-sigma factor FlgM [Paenibacillus sp. GCM10027626]|uniref:flagellar biosynthesis anti-sigma factor FlgM n=1 Tax=Paenibacillus sp. GCM10027626 TaxID=3273411 RepID=UPI003624DC6A
MKINEIQRIGAVNPYKQNQEQRTGQTERKRSRDEVQISAEAQEMLSYSRANDTERAKRVQALKQEVSSGTYHVDAGKIAEKVWPFLKK